MTLLFVSLDENVITFRACDFSWKSPRKLVKWNSLVNRNTELRFAFVQTAYISICVRSKSNRNKRIKLISTSTFNTQSHLLVWRGYLHHSIWSINAFAPESNYPHVTVAHIWLCVFSPFCFLFIRITFDSLSCIVRLSRMKTHRA